MSGSLLSRFRDAFGSIVASFVTWLKQRHALVAIFYCYSFFLLGCTIAAVGPALKEIAGRGGEAVR
jgi:hypothetical protein